MRMMKYSVCRFLVCQFFHFHQRLADGSCTVGSLPLKGVSASSSSSLASYCAGLLCMLGLRCPSHVTDSVAP